MELRQRMLQAEVRAWNWIIDWEIWPRKFCNSII